MAPRDDALYNALATMLPSNSTLRRLDLERHKEVTYDDFDWAPVLSALGRNTGLLSLKLDCLYSIDGLLCTAIKDGLSMNETLERLAFGEVPLRDDNAVMWCGAFSFLRTNKVLESLSVTFDQDVTELCFSAFCIDIAGMLQENTSLVSLAIQHNGSVQLNDDESKQMASLLKKNYALSWLSIESLPDIGRMGDVGAILQLNAAGRRYLIEDGSSISKGVDVLNLVNDDINCLFLHLLENPRLCDRRAVEIVTTEESESESNPTVTSGRGKREKAGLHESRGSRRRLA
jgi:hypothetical protein